MPFFRLLPFTRRITQRTVLWGLVLGFGLVVILLGLAGLVAVRDTRAIRSSAAVLVKEQLLIARLMHEVQVEENTLTALDHARIPFIQRVVVGPVQGSHIRRIKTIRQEINAQRNDTYFGKPHFGLGLCKAQAFNDTISG